jgi:hypothetical protein
VSDLVHPSSLWIAEKCPLRFYYEHFSYTYPLVLPPPLSGVRGQLLHAVLEDVESYPDREPAHLRSRARERFTQHRSALNKELSREPWFETHFDLETRLPWTAVARDLIPLATRAARQPAVPARIRRTEGTSTGSGIAAYPGVEVGFACHELGVAGRIDLVRATADGFEVVDFKTGTASGVERAWILQLWAYAAAMESLGEQSIASLWIETPTERILVEWDDACRFTVTELLAGARQLLSSPGPAIASPSVCRGCPVRHRCDVYRATAPNWWASIPETTPSPDVWGTVVDIEYANEFLDVTLERPDGRKSRVTGVPPTRGRHLTGDIAAFSLEITGVRRLPAGRPGMSNLHEMAPDDSRKQAWGTAWFDSSTPCSNNRLPA